MIKKRQTNISLTSWFNLKVRVCLYFKFWRIHLKYVLLACGAGHVIILTMLHFFCKTLHELHYSVTCCFCLKTLVLTYSNNLFKLLKNNFLNRALKLNNVRYIPCNSYSYLQTTLISQIKLKKKINCLQRPLFYLFQNIQSRKFKSKTRRLRFSIFQWYHLLWRIKCHLWLSRYTCIILWIVMISDSIHTFED